MASSDRDQDVVRNAGASQQRRRASKVPRAEVISELPMVTLLLVGAVLVAMLVAGGPVLDMLASFGSIAAR